MEKMDEQDNEEERKNKNSNRLREQTKGGLTDALSLSSRMTDNNEEVTCLLEKEALQL